MNRKPIIFFCDDKPKWTTMFKERHGQQFEIETTNDNGEFTQKLSSLIKQGKTPDIILIDLYHSNGEKNPIVKKRLEKEGDDAIERLKEAIAAAKIPINTAWAPCGFEMLEQARKLCPHTPIAIYTEQGLTLAGNAELQKVSGSEGEWFLKGQNEFYEKYKLNKMLAANLYARTTKHALLILSAVIIIATIAYSAIVEKKFDHTLSFGATLVSLAIAVMPRIISYIVQKKRR